MNNSFNWKWRQRQMHTYTHTMRNLKEKDVIWNCARFPWNSCNNFVHIVNETRSGCFRLCHLNHIAKTMHLNKNSTKKKKKKIAPCLVFKWGKWIKSLCVACGQRITMLVYLHFKSNVFKWQMRFSSVLILWNRLAASDNCDARRNRFRGIDFE